MAVALVPFFFCLFLGLSRLTRSLDCLLSGESQPGLSPKGYHGGNVVFLSSAIHISVCQPHLTAQRPASLLSCAPVTQTLPYGLSCLSWWAVMNAAQRAAGALVLLAESGPWGISILP